MAACNAIKPMLGLGRNGHVSVNKGITSMSRASPRRDVAFAKQTATITTDVLDHVLKENGLELRRYAPSQVEAKDRDPLDPDCYEAAQAVKTASSVMLRDYGGEMRQLCSTLNTCDDCFYGTYSSAAHTILQSEINWGRLAALLTFTGLLAAHLIEDGDGAKIESLLGWERLIIRDKCYDWIEQHGGWVKEGEGLPERVWERLQNVDGAHERVEDWCESVRSGRREERCKHDGVISIAACSFDSYVSAVTFGAERPKLAETAGSWWSTGTLIAAQTGAFIVQWMQK